MALYINSLLPKVSDPDADIRYMSLLDVFGALDNSNTQCLENDRNTSTKLTDSLLKALEDQHGEVQNQALKWLVLSDCFLILFCNQSAIIVEYSLLIFFFFF